ncbi:MAG: hypothetical protein R3E12_14815 [Candidatus Eisenbacteria bacterium]
MVQTFHWLDALEHAGMVPAAREAGDDQIALRYLLQDQSAPIVAGGEYGTSKRSHGLEPANLGSVRAVVDIVDRVDVGDRIEIALIDHFLEPSPGQRLCGFRIVQPGFERTLVTTARAQAPTSRGRDQATRYGHVLLIMGLS